MADALAKFDDMGIRVWLCGVRAAKPPIYYDITASEVLTKIFWNIAILVCNLVLSVTYDHRL